MAFVAALAAAAAIAVWAMLPEVPMPPKISLKQQLMPLADPRIGLTLLTALLTMSGLFTDYTYFTVEFDRAIADNGIVFEGLLVLWGAAGTLAK